MKSQALALLANQTASPDVVFGQTLDAALSGNHPRRVPETPETVARWDLNRSLAFYRARFADAGNFTFVFVGSFTPATIRPLVETYIASLPAGRTHETWRDLGIRPPRGVIQRTVEKGIAPKSQVSIVFSGPFVYDDASQMAFEAMSLLLRSRLSDAIRQELGATYSITVDSDIARVPTPEYRVRIDWTCDPAQTASLIQRVFEEVAFVRSTLLTPVQVGRVQDVFLREFERNSQENSYVLNQIVGRYEEGDAANVGRALRPQGDIAGLNGYAIQLAARNYLDLANYVQVTLMPETK
jgi:zinc protease